MQNLNRRQWLKAAGISGAALTSFNPLLANENSTNGSPNHGTDELIRLSSNENPYGPSPIVKEAMTKAMDIAYKYPPGHYAVLIEKIMAKEGVPKDHILLVSGSNEGLKVTGLHYSLGGGEIVTCAPTYLALLSYAKNIGATVNAAPVDENLGFDLQEMEKRVSAKTKMVFLCNPNNPTGSLLPADAVKDFCETVSNKTMVFSDEAYYDYIEDKNYPSMVSLVKEGKNVIVSRTFSKVYGMAGVRVGYLIARPDIISALKPKVMSYVNMMGVYGAAAAMDDKAFYKLSLAKNKEAKEYIYKTADELGMRYIPTHTNFVFLETGRDIVELNNQMKTKGVLVGRPFAPYDTWCRVSTGKMEHVEAWSKAMKSLFA